MEEDPTVLEETPSTEIVPDDVSKSTPSPIIASARTSSTVPPEDCVHSTEPFPWSNSTSVSPVASDGGTMQTAVTRSMATTAIDASALPFIDNPQS